MYQGFIYWNGGSGASRARREVDEKAAMGWHGYMVGTQSIRHHAYNLLRWPWQIQIISIDRAKSCTHQWPPERWPPLQSPPTSPLSSPLTPANHLHLQCLPPTLKQPLTRSFSTTALPPFSPGWGCFHHCPLLYAPKASWTHHPPPVPINNLQWGCFHRPYLLCPPTASN